MDGYKSQKQTHRIRIKALIWALTLAAIVPTIIFQSILMFMYVPSESMYPALTSGDLVFGVRRFSKLERGNIVAFQAENIVMIKRIIGLPGETVDIDEDGAVYINGILLDEPYVENQRNGRAQTFEVPEECLLLLGDNRTHSHDARFWEDPYVGTNKVLAIAKYKLLGGFIK